MSESEPSGDYYRRRAGEERAAAEAAVDERVRQTHIDLAQRYLDAAANGVEPSPPDESNLSPDVGPEFRIIP